MAPKSSLDENPTWIYSQNPMKCQEGIPPPVYINTAKDLGAIKGGCFIPDIHTRID